MLRIVYITIAMRISHDYRLLFWSYPITWTFTSLLYIIYYFQGGWLRRRIRLRTLLATPDN